MTYGGEWEIGNGKWNDLTGFALLRRSAVSVASNIAEGHGRSSRREFARYALIARGSLKEAETQVLIAQRQGYLAAEKVVELLALATRLNRLLTGLRRGLGVMGLRGRQLSVAPRADT